MKFLIIDDTPEHLRPLMQTLREAGHFVAIARDLGTAWAWLQRGDVFDLIAIDLALDRYIKEFSSEQTEINKGLASRHLSDLPMSGQALGLRLWRQRTTLKNRYCYITNHRHLWLERLGNDPEFDGKAIDDLIDVILDKSSLFSRNIADKFSTAKSFWDGQQWL